jgi:signal transduction histidine kinase/CheY-like chemotaxis protein
MAILAVAAALLARLVLDPLLGNALPFFLPCLAVVVVAWHGGFGPSLVALLLGLLATAYLFLPPRHDLSASLAGHRTLAGGFLFLGVTIGVFSEALWAARRRAEGHAREADRRRQELEEEVARGKRLEQELQRRAEQLADADRRKDQFVMMLAHELRNPLAPLRNGLQLLQASPNDGQAVEQARTMMARQVGHMARIIDELLDVSRILRGRIELRPERLDVGRLARTVLEDQRPALDRAGLTLEADLPELPVWVNADPTRLTQVLDNLLQNAVKFTDRGGKVTVRAWADAGRRQAMLAVRDTGAGIEPDLLPHLFEPFTQADRSLDRSKGGLGLGLSLVKGLVKLHGGEVHASSGGPGRGAEFVVRLPLQPEPAAVSKMPAAPERDPRRLRVLVVEDNRDTADTLKLLLEWFGYEVTVAYTGPSGVQTAKEWRPDVILCDIGLPGLDGFGVARELRRHPATAKALLIAVTGYGGEEDRLRSREAGFDAHLTKPADPGELRELLAAH